MKKIIHKRLLPTPFFKLVETVIPEFILINKYFRKSEPKFLFRKGVTSAILISFHAISKFLTLRNKTVFYDTLGMFL